MIPKRPRDEIELTSRDLQVVMEPAPALMATVDVVVVVAVHGRAPDPGRCLSSIAAQQLDTARLGVVLCRDQVGNAPPDIWLPARIQPRTWLLKANCGSPARARNTLLEFVEQRIPSCRWIARLDWDDRFAQENSLAAAVAQAEQTGALFVLGGNRVVSADGALHRLNPATVELTRPDGVADRLREMADGTAENELPSCNLLLAADAGLRYPDTASAEDHWLVADLLIHHQGRGAILTRPLLVDYTLDGQATQLEKGTDRYRRSRRALHAAAQVWTKLRHLPGERLGLGQEGFVRLHQGQVYKHFYPGIMTDEKVRWLGGVGQRSAVIPSPLAFAPDEQTGGWLVSYRHDETRPFLRPDPDAVRQFLIGCLAEGVVCGNIKRSNFRVRPSGALLYIDIGNWIVPADVSIFRDSAARLYSIGVLGNSDEEVLRRRADLSQPEIWERLPGFAQFYGELVSTHIRRQWAAAPRPAVRPPARRHPEVSLLIKACAMDAAYARDQIIHIADQLVGPHDFAERALLIDTHTGSFLRQHNPGDLAGLLAIADELQRRRVLDRILIAPSDEATLRQINQRWFAADCAGSHSSWGVPVAPQVWGFEQMRTRYVLQCDIDSLIGRRHQDHDYLSEMLDAIRGEGVVCVAFNIPHAPHGGFHPYEAPPGEYKPEVRCGLLDLDRLRSLRPLPAGVLDGKLDTTWYRALHQVQRQGGLRTLRGGSPDTFYVHPPNTRKQDLDEFARIRDLIAQGLVPRSQWGRWDLEAPSEAWRHPRRSEPIVVLARGRNTDPARLTRFVDSLAMQDDQSFGVIILDDASDRERPSELSVQLTWLGDRLSLLRHSRRRHRMTNNLIALREVCDRNDSLIVVVDLDDALADRSAITRIRHLAERDHDVILAAPFRPDVPTKVYHPDFTRPRATYGGDVWIHLRAFRKSLFDALPDDALQLDGRWIDDCEDYAIMIPIVEAAKKPIYVPEYLYWHERHTVLDEAGQRQRDQTITRILSMRTTSAR